MDFRKYADKKAKGLAQIVRAGGGFAFATKRFSPETGEQLNPAVEAVDLQMLQARKQALQDELASINEIIAEIQEI